MIIMCSLHIENVYFLQFVFAYVQMAEIRYRMTAQTYVTNLNFGSSSICAKYVPLAFEPGLS